MPRRSLSLAASVVLATAAGLLAAAPGASAYDSYPCPTGLHLTAPWTTEEVQTCPLGAALPTGIPVYAQPIANALGAQPPAPAGWLQGTVNKVFVCQKHFPAASYHHPVKGWRNVWWAYTRSDEGVMGWVPEVFFYGGENDEADYGLRACTDPKAPPPDPPPPAPPEVDPCDASTPAPNLRMSASLPRHRSSGPMRTATLTKYGASLQVQGQLTHADGTPIAGARICVATGDVGASASVRQEAVVQTDAVGRFGYRIAHGPSRQVRFVYRTAGGAASAGVVVRVRAPVAFRATPNRLRTGGTVKLAGRLRWPDDGVLVELQVLRAGKWQTLLGTTRTRADGRFSLNYRFARAVPGVTKYRFRALVPAQPGYPFARGASPTVVVGVRG